MSVNLTAANAMVPANPGDQFDQDGLLDVRWILQFEITEQHDADIARIIAGYMRALVLQ